MDPRIVFPETIAPGAICYGKASGFWGFGNQIWEPCIERTRSFAFRRKCSCRGPTVICHND
jgi:hypothetical protein